MLRKCGYSKKVSKAGKGLAILRIKHPSISPRRESFSHIIMLSSTEYVHVREDTIEVRAYFDQGIRCTVYESLPICEQEGGVGRLLMSGRADPGLAKVAIYMYYV